MHFRRRGLHWEFSCKSSYQQSSSGQSPSFRISRVGSVFPHCSIQSMVGLWRILTFLIFPEAHGLEVGAPRQDKRVLTLTLFPPKASRSCTKLQPQKVEKNDTFILFLWLHDTGFLCLHSHFKSGCSLMSVIFGISGIS